jgi:hypothetical protein
MQYLVCGSLATFSFDYSGMFCGSNPVECRLVNALEIGSMVSRFNDINQARAYHSKAPGLPIKAENL